MSAKILTSSAVAGLLAENEQLLAMLRHALAFIEHAHAVEGEPISEVDSIEVGVDHGPMTCDLKRIRRVIATASLGSK